VATETPLITPEVPIIEPANSKVDPPAPPEVTEPVAAEPEEEEEDPLEILEPKAEPRMWIIGKPPEKGGEEDEWSRYIQRPLGYMSRMRFFALVSGTVAKAMKEGGGISIGGADFLGTDAGSLRDRAESLRSEDFEDAGSFMALALQLIGTVPDFLIECYAIWLDVPMQERNWFRRVLNQSCDPEHNRWGITDDQGLEMVEIFIDQNYKDIREFFSGKLPALAKRVQAREREIQKTNSNGAAQKSASGR
jgi:hypothetical protein